MRGMVLQIAHRQRANVDGAETFGVLFDEELTLVISRNGHDWPTVVLHLGVAQSGVDDKFRLVIPVDLELDDGKIAFVRRARMVGNTSPSRAGAAQKDKEQAAARGHQLL